MVDEFEGCPLKPQQSQTSVLTVNSEVYAISTNRTHYSNLNENESQKEPLIKQENFSKNSLKPSVGKSDISISPNTESDKNTLNTLANVSDASYLKHVSEDSLKREDVYTNPLVYEEKFMEKKNELDLFEKLFRCKQGASAGELNQNIESTKIDVQSINNEQLGSRLMEVNIEEIQQEVELPESTEQRGKNPLRISDEVNSAENPVQEKIIEPQEIDILNVRKNLAQSSFTETTNIISDIPSLNKSKEITVHTNPVTEPQSQRLKSTNRSSQATKRKIEAMQENSPNRPSMNGTLKIFAQEASQEEVETSWDLKGFLQNGQRKVEKIYVGKSGLSKIDFIQNSNNLILGGNGVFVHSLNSQNINCEDIPQGKQSFPFIIHSIFFLLIQNRVRSDKPEKRQ